MLRGACRSCADGVDGAKQGIVACVDIKLIWLVGIGRIVATDGYHLYCLAVVYAICTAPAGTPEHAFCRFITSIPGQKVLLNTGVLPSNMPPARSVNIVMDE